MANCKVKAGGVVTNWAGDLTPEQCARFPAGKVLGAGTFATAYIKADEPDKVVKFTADYADAQAARKLLGKKLQGTVGIYDVAELKGQKTSVPGFSSYDRIYAITTERVEQLPTRMHPAAYGTRFLRVGYHLAKDKCLKEAGPDDDYRESCDTVLPKMADALDELRSEGVEAEDTHARNWGLRNGEPVLLDLGVSSFDLATVPPIDLAALRKGKKKMRHNRLGAFEGGRNTALYVALGVGLIAIMLWPKKSTAATGAASKNATPAPKAGGSAVGTFTDPTTGVLIEGPSGQIGVGIAYTVQRGESWSNIASRVFGDWRWWPFLWDMNRGNGTQFTNPDLLNVGDSISIPAATPASAAYQTAIFARANAHRRYWLDKNAGKSVTMPAIVFEQTPRPQ